VQIDSDYVHVYLARHKDVFMRMVKKYNESFYEAAKELGRKNGKEDDAQCIDLLLDYAVNTGRLENFRKFMNTVECSMPQTG